MGIQYGFNHDGKRCIGCQSCQVACKQFNGVKAGVVGYRNVVSTTSGTYPDVKRVFLSTSCQHCEQPACVAACPRTAISKRAEDGIVVVDQSKCVGCRRCLSACPFGAPKFADSVMQKCEFCLSQNLPDGAQTRCAAACPTRALRSGSIEEL
jgi:anaerobic dimethyl sulfoxide reductase subunit B (iron-sulfur subunit)